MKSPAFTSGLLTPRGIRGPFRSGMADKGKGNKAAVAPRQTSFTPHKDALGHTFETLILGMALAPACLIFTSSAIEMFFVTSS